jgi:hypothetical protein
MECPDRMNVLSVKVLTFIGYKRPPEIFIEIEDNKEVKIMKDVRQNISKISGFLYCPRCGLRRPKVEILGCYGGYCPSCGTRMVEEGSIPYSSKKYHSNANHILFFR